MCSTDLSCVSQLLAVTRDALEDKSEPEIAILTSESRDTWATLRERLLDISPVNAESLSQIQNALFVLNLDDYSLPDAADKAYEQFFWGSRLQNRWFDKVVQIIVANNGRAGLNGEHSPCDAVITCTALDYAVASEVRHKDVEDRDVAMPPPVKLQWKVDDVISNGIDAARGRAQKLAKLLISDVLVFPIYGGRYIRDTARISPDTYVQLALQLAWARVNEEPTSIYETATQRLFLNGRTETCRSLSVESEAFARAFDNDDVLVSV